MSSGDEAGFRNVYEAADYAEDYAALEWTGTYNLVRRELPEVLRAHVTGRRAIDFGCGTGRSARLLRSLGFEVTGVDISPSMVARARQLDPGGDYHLLADGGLAELGLGPVDLVLAAFPFDNTPAPEKARWLGELRRQLAPGGRVVNVVSAPEIYTHEWASFTTQDFPENRAARDGDVVRIVTREFSTGRPCEDILCSDEAYRGLYEQAGLAVLAVSRPLARGDEGLPWVSETRVAPWVIWVLEAAR